MRRTLALIMLCLAIGAVVTVAIAWIHAAFVDGLSVRLSHESERGVSRRDFPRWEVVVSRARCSTVIRHTPMKETTPVLPAPLRADADPREIDLWVRTKAAFERGQPPPAEFQLQRPVVDIPSWSRAAQPPGERSFDANVRTTTYIEDARGWPFRALISYHDSRRGNAATPPGASPPWRVNLGGEQGPIGLARGLPLKPIALGFIADTLTFGGLMYLLFASVGLRARLRRWRGHCPRCGYNLRGKLGAGCSECGWGRVQGTRTS